MDSYVQFVTVPDSSEDLRTRFLAQLSASKTWTSVDYFTPIHEAITNNGINIVFYKPHERYGFSEEVYGIILSGHVDFTLEKLGAKFNWPRGFPIMWYPERQIKFFGFRPKFKNDKRQKRPLFRQ